MNNRYLFRAKRIDNGEWMEGYYLFCPIQEDNKPSLENFTYKHWIVTHNGNPFKVDKYTICQCTGLKDKNGKLIWENDIVLLDDEYWLVGWSDNDAQFTIEDDCTIEHFGNVWGVDCEVYGNLFDNPELMYE